MIDHAGSTPQTAAGSWGKLSFAAGLAASAALLLFWLQFIFDVLPQFSHTGDDVNFYGPLAEACRDGACWQKFLTPQGPHFHFFYKLQTLAIFNYADWSARLIPLVGLLLHAAVFVFLVKRFQLWRTGGLAIVLLLALATTLFGPYLNRQVTYHMLGLSPTVHHLSAMVAILLAYLYVSDQSGTKTTGVLIGYVAALVLNIGFVGIATAPFLVLGIAAACGYTLLTQWHQGGIIWPIIKRSVPIVGIALVFALIYRYALSHYANGGELAGSSELHLSGRMIFETILSSRALSTLPAFAAGTLAAALYIAMFFGGLALAVRYNTRHWSTALLIGNTVMVLSMSLAFTLLRGSDALRFPRYEVLTWIIWLPWVISMIELARLRVRPGVTQASAVLLSLSSLIALFGLFNIAKQERLLTTYFSRIENEVLSSDPYSAELHKKISCRRPAADCASLIKQMQCNAGRQNACERAGPAAPNRQLQLSPSSVPG